MPEGLALFDEAMVGVAAGEVSPMFAGHVYCVMIEGCQEISDLRPRGLDRRPDAGARRSPGWSPFTGQCAVHRGQIMRLHGAFRAAVEEFDGAVARYLSAGTVPAAGLALAERGDVLRLLGELDAAEASYERAAEHGYEPSPGSRCCGWPAGAPSAALAAVRRLLAETPDPVGRSRLLPAAVEILLAGDDRAEARAAALELEAIAADFGCDALHRHGCARGRPGRARGRRRGRRAALPAQGADAVGGDGGALRGGPCGVQVGRALPPSATRRRPPRELAAARGV